MSQMTMTELDPQVRVLARLQSIRHTDNRFMRAVTRAVTRAYPPKPVDGISVRVVTIGTASVRVFTPSGRRRRAALLWIHGGGLIVGAARQDDGLCARTAAQLDIVVVSVEYRLAPENPYPAAIDDVHAAWKWLVSRAEALDVDSQRLAIGGESAGGGLAACLVQRVHDDGGTQPVAQWLFAPMLDDRTAANRALDGRNHFVWNNHANRYGWRVYLQQEPGAENVPPYASAARRTDVSGLPPTWIYATDLELFHDEDLAYADRLRAAGVPTTWVVVKGAPHAFELPENTELAQKLFHDARAWLAEQLNGATTH